MMKQITILLTILFAALTFTSCGTNFQELNTSFTPSATLSLGNEFTSAYDIAAVSSSLYSTDADGINAVNLETGVSEKLSEGEYAFCSSNGTAAYFYNPSLGEITCIDGGKQAVIKSDSLACSADDFAVTDGYLAALSSGELIITDKSGANCRTDKLADGVVGIYPYKENKLFVTVGDVSGFVTAINVYDIDTQKSSKINGITSADSFGHIAYYDYDSSVLAVIYNRALDVHSLYSFKLDGNKASAMTRLTDLEPSAKIAVSQNVISIVEAQGYRCYDYNNKPPQITVIYFDYIVNTDLELIARTFEKNEGIIVNLVRYENENDVAIVETKLMAGDKDVDIYYIAGMGIPPVYREGAYTELSQYEALTQKLEANPTADYLCNYDGNRYGVPIKVKYESKDLLISPGVDSYEPMKQMIFDDFGKRGNVASKYIYKNINPMTEEYLDQNGDELFEVFKWLYAHPDDPYENDVYPEDMSLIWSDYLILNRNSENKELAVKLLEYAVDLQSGSVKPASGELMYFYPELDTQRLHLAYHAGYRYRDILALPIVELNKTDGSDEALRKLAQDTARSIKLRMEG